MKLTNIIKKKTNVKIESTNVQKLEKNQLSQIIGGGDDTSTLDSIGTSNKTRGMMGQIKNS